MGLDKPLSYHALHAYRLLDVKETLPDRDVNLYFKDVLTAFVESGQVVRESNAYKLTQKGRETYGRLTQTLDLLAQSIVSGRHDTTVFGAVISREALPLYDMIHAYHLLDSKKQLSSTDMNQYLKTAVGMFELVGHVEKLTEKPVTYALTQSGKAAFVKLKHDHRSKMITDILSGVYNDKPFGTLVKKPSSSVQSSSDLDAMMMYMSEVMDGDCDVSGDDPDCDDDSE